MGTSWARPHGEVAARRVVVRFKDDDVVDGVVGAVDFDAPDFTLEFSDAPVPGVVAIVPFASVKSILIQRVELETHLDRTHMSSVAVHFWDGEVVHGLLGSEPERRRYGMTLPLVSPALDEIEVLGIPYAAVKAMFLSGGADGFGSGAILAKGWRIAGVGAPLVGLLGEIRRLSLMRTNGDITDDDFARRRREVLSKI